MSFRMSITYEKKASASLLEKVKAYYGDAPPKKTGWHSSFSIWDIPEVKSEMENGVQDASNKLDAQAKGWKPVAEGKEIQYGTTGDHTDVEFWYQKVYTK